MSISGRHGAGMQPARESRCAIPAAADPPEALAGVRVVDLTSGLAGPVAGMLLADLGADVIKVVPADGGGQTRPGLRMWDRGKRLAAADPGCASDMAALESLIGRADIVLVGTSGGAVSFDDLCGQGLRPGEPAFWIVMPPYLLGETPWAGGRESAGLLLAWLGHAWNQSSYDDVPVDCSYPLALYMQAIWAATVAVALLTGRRRGRRLAPLAVAGGAHGGQLVSPGAFAVDRDEPHVHRPGGPGGALPNYRCYRCADGHWLFFGAFTTAFIERGCSALGADWLLADPRVGGDPARLRLPGNLTWISRELEKIFAMRPRAQWLELLAAADVPAAAVTRPGHWLDHPQVQALGLRAQVCDDYGQGIMMPGPLIGLSRTPVTIRAAAPARRAAITDLAGSWSPRTATSADGIGSGMAEPPLSGLRVLDLGTIIAGPYAATLLGELGADVIKVERPPAGDEFRIAHGGRGGVGFSVYNREQRSVMLDLRGGPDRDVFCQLVRSTDVVVDNYRSGVLNRLGIRHDRLRTVNPLVTSVSISAFGDAGPLGGRPGFDPIIQALSGIMRGQGGPNEDDSPVFLTVPINDVLAAGLAALGACAALMARPGIGAGQQVSVTLCAAACLLQSEYLVTAAGQSAAPPAGGRDFAGPTPLDSLHRTADGWVRLGSPASATEPATVVPSAASTLLDALPRLRTADAIRRAAAAGIPAVRARQPRELAGDEQLVRHGLLTIQARDEAGATSVRPGRWLEIPGLATAPPGEAPDLGEHSAAILAELGLVRDGSENGPAAAAPETARRSVRSDDPTHA